MADDTLTQDTEKQEQDAGAIDAAPQAKEATEVLDAAESAATHAAETDDGAVSEQASSAPAPLATTKTDDGSVVVADAEGGVALGADGQPIATQDGLPVVTLGDDAGEHEGKTVLADPTTGEPALDSEGEIIEATDVELLERDDGALVVGDPAGEGAVLTSSGDPIVPAEPSKEGEAESQVSELPPPEAGDAAGGASDAGADAEAEAPQTTPEQPAPTEGMGGSSDQAAPADLQAPQVDDAAAAPDASQADSPAKDPLAGQSPEPQPVAVPKPDTDPVADVLELDTGNPINVPSPSVANAAQQGEVAPPQAVHPCTFQPLVGDGLGENVGKVGELAPPPQSKPQTSDDADVGSSKRDDKRTHKALRRIEDRIEGIETMVRRLLRALR